MQNGIFDPTVPLYVGQSFTWAHGVETLLRLLIAFGLGAFLAHRPWRSVLAHRAPRVQADTAQTQAIIAVAGALLVVVIGDSLARAFGLVGLGTFIRFRAGVKDPRDVAVLFVMIGIGMACGLGLVGTAALGTLFVACVLAIFDRFAPPRQRSLTITVTAPEPTAVREAVRAAFRDARAVEVRTDGAENGRVSFAIAATDDEDALTILETLRKHGADAVKAVRIEEESGR
jgi:uncharacterized membrane protein YhiD involved in acid resistance